MRAERSEFARPKLVSALAALNAAQALLAVAMATPLTLIAAEQTRGLTLRERIDSRFFVLPAALALLALSSALVAWALLRPAPAARRAQILVAIAWLPAVPYGSLAGVLSLFCMFTPGAKVLFSTRAPRTAEQLAAVGRLAQPSGGLRLVYVALVTLTVLGIVYALNLFGGVARELLK